jgi:hypothetical protein
MTVAVWGPVQAELTDLLAEDPTDIAGVVDRLVAVQGLLDRLPPLSTENPVADFNRLYTKITKDVLARYGLGGFADPEFLNCLDVEFAKRYFNALRLWGSGSPDTPEAWMVLFRRCDDRRLRSLPCAVAGVNAHINYDLPFALVSTWEQVGFQPGDSPQHQDFLLINDVFFEAIPNLRHSYLDTWGRYIDRLNGGFDDWYQNLLVELTRDIAWDRAVRLWQLRRDALAVEAERVSFDRRTALGGRLLLSPFMSRLQ